MAVVSSEKGWSRQRVVQTHGVDCDVHLKRATGLCASFVHFTRVAIIYVPPRGTCAEMNMAINTGEKCVYRVNLHARHRYN